MSEWWKMIHLRFDVWRVLFFFSPCPGNLGLFQGLFESPCSLPGKWVFIEEERKADRQDGREETEL